MLIGSLKQMAENSVKIGIPMTIRVEEMQGLLTFDAHLLRAIEGDQRTDTRAITEILIEILHLGDDGRGVAGRTPGLLHVIAHQQADLVDPEEQSVHRIDRLFAFVD